MLTQVTSGAGVSSVSTKTQVVVSLATTSGVIVYTVPPGRRFDGVIVGYYGQTNSANINDVMVNVSGTYGSNYVPVSLLAGTRVKATAQSVTMVGVESDA